MELQSRDEVVVELNFSSACQIILITQEERTFAELCA